MFFSLFVFLYVSVYAATPTDLDLDGDSLSNFYEENISKTNPNSVDSDGDLLWDNVEINLTKTNPLVFDSDKDSLSDGYEFLISKTNPNSVDSDRDYLWDNVEINLTKTNPNVWDTDGDYISDGYEFLTSKTSPLSKDTDGDLIDDNVEIFTNKSNPLVPDMDHDGWDQLTDCNDFDPHINPAAKEICNSNDEYIDDNCDGVILYFSASSPYGLGFFDNDLDGFGGTSYPVQSEVINFCEDFTGWSDNFYDCDDDDPEVNIIHEEIIDGKDNDCNSLIDDMTFIFDDDMDGYSEYDGDCNDANYYIYPGAEEFWNGIDDDCDLIIDNNAIMIGIWYEDKDFDGFGDINAEPIESIFKLDGYSQTNDDCDDNNSLIHPYAKEELYIQMYFFDIVDSNCNGVYIY